MASRCVACGCRAPAGVEVCDRCQQAEYQQRALGADADREREVEYLARLEEEAEADDGW